MFIEVHDPFKLRLVIDLPIGIYCNGPIALQTALEVPTGKVILTLNNQKWRDSKPNNIDARNGSCLFSIARLYTLLLPISINTCNIHLVANIAYYEARFSKL